MPVVSVTRVSVRCRSTSASTWSDVYPEDSYEHEVEEADLAKTIATNQQLKCIFDLSGRSNVGHLTIAVILGYAEYLQYL